MAISLAQRLGTYADYDASTTTVLSPASKTVTSGDTILVAWAGYGTATGISCADNLGNTYSLAESVVGSSPSTAALLYAPVTVGGSLTTLTVTHSSILWRRVVASEYSGVGTLYSVGGGVGATSGTVTFVTNKTIPANGAAFGCAGNEDLYATAAGSDSGSPSTSVVVDYDGWGSVFATCLLYSVAGASEVTAYTGTGTGTSSKRVGAGGIFNPAASGGPVWTTPADTVSMGTTPELKFTSPASAVAQHFYLQLDTANSFDTGDLRTVNSSASQTDWAYWDGDSWEALPAGGLASGFAGNEIRYTVTSALSSATWYRRVRAGTLV